MLVICQYCKSQTNKVEKKDAVRIDNKNFHEKCAQQYLNRKELNETICRIFNLKAPGPRNNAFISKYLNEGLTLKGMTHTLIYFYEIKKNDKSKANQGIGIIPYVYEEAKKFYERDKMGEKKAEQAFEKNREKRERLNGLTRKVKEPKEKPITLNLRVYDDEDLEW